MNIVMELYGDGKIRDEWKQIDVERLDSQCTHNLFVVLLVLLRSFVTRQAAVARHGSYEHVNDAKTFDFGTCHIGRSARQLK